MKNLSISEFKFSQSKSRMSDGLGFFGGGSDSSDSEVEEAPGEFCFVADFCTTNSRQFSKESKIVYCSPLSGSKTGTPTSTSFSVAQVQKEETTQRTKSALPAPEEVLLVRQKSSFFNEESELAGVNWNNDSLVSSCCLQWSNKLSQKLK